MRKSICFFFLWYCPMECSITEKIVNVLCLNQLVFLTTAFFQGKDTCQFDGGGPLVCNDLLTGVIGTFGASCAAKDTPR